MKNWTGNKNSIFKTLGASNHTDKERQKEDYYATDPIAAELLLQNEDFNDIWECACGEGHLSKVFDKHGKLLKASDLIDRGYGEVEDFLSLENQYWYGDIITNPPYRYAQQFIEKAMTITKEGGKVAMFLKLQFLEGKARKEMYRKFPLYKLIVSSSRINCAMNGDFVKYKANTAVAYGWFIWINGYKGKPTIEWIN